jgi:Integrase core domain
MTTELALLALLAAVRKRKPKSKVMIPSDQGSQVTIRDWQVFLGQHNLGASMSRRGNCHDNAVAESFFQLLKRERIRHRTDLTREAAGQDVVDYIEMFYNPKRKHTNNGMLSPVDFETRQQKLKEAGVQETRGTSRRLDRESRQSHEGIAPSPTDDIPPNMASILPNLMGCHRIGTGIVTTKYPQKTWAFRTSADRGGRRFGAGEGNRTLVVSLGSFCSTIELHPREIGFRHSASGRQAASGTKSRVGRQGTGS